MAAYVHYRKQICRKSGNVKSKPFPMPRRLDYVEEKDPGQNLIINVEEVEMEDIHEGDDKDDYYFEDPTNIGSYILYIYND